MTFEEFIEINKKYGLSRMWTDELENIAKEEYEEHVRHLADVFDNIFNKDKSELESLLKSFILVISIIGIILAIL